MMLAFIMFFVELLSIVVFGHFVSCWVQSMRRLRPGPISVQKCIHGWSCIHFWMDIVHVHVCLNRLCSMIMVCYRLEIFCHVIGICCRGCQHRLDTSAAAVCSFGSLVIV